MTTFLKARWENIVMANYAVPANTLTPYLPKGTELDTYQGQVYVSLVGFLFKDTRLFKIPIPTLGTFEEVNLRFYVVRKEGTEIKRGVVFINETVPYKVVAWLANKLYKEHYTAVRTKHSWEINSATKILNYQWLIAKKWNSIRVEAETKPRDMLKDSFEEFIFEHYYGYTKLNTSSTEEYTIDHARWKTHALASATIDCDFEANYGPDFAFLNGLTPASVFVAEGSAIKVNWKRKKI
jgi:uncharacterized protein YqjF (DUF2071 family)